MSVFCLFVLQAIISAIVVAVFLSSYFKYRYGPQYYYLCAILGVSVVLKGDSVSTGVHTPHLIEIINRIFTCFQDSLCWSRGAASVLYVSCCLVLLPMCRNVLALIRNSNKVRRTTPGTCANENLD